MATYALLHKSSKTFGASLLCVVTVSQETSDSGETFVHCHATELLRRKQHLFSFPTPRSFGALPLWRRTELAAELASSLRPKAGDGSVSAGFAVELPVELRTTMDSNTLFPRRRLPRSSTRILPASRLSVRRLGHPHSPERLRHLLLAAYHLEVHKRARQNRRRGDFLELALGVLHVQLYDPKVNARARYLASIS